MVQTLEDFGFNKEQNTYLIGDLNFDAIGKNDLTKYLTSICLGSNKNFFSYKLFIISYMKFEIKENLQSSRFSETSKTSGNVVKE